MKTKLIFECDDTEEGGFNDQKELQRIMNYAAPASVLWEFDQYLRGLIKYTELEDGVATALEAAREKLWELCRDENLSMDGLCS